MKVKIKLENNILTGYLFIKQTEPKLIKTGCNFDENKDIDNAIEIIISSLDDLKIGEVKYIDGQFIEMTEEEKQSFRRSLDEQL